MLRVTGVASNTVPLIEVIISASTAGFGGGQGGSTYKNLFDSFCKSRYGLSYAGLIFSMR